MLYPEIDRPLWPELFKNPTREYRGTPFWSWNTRLDRQELLRQIECLKEMGFGGFHMHVRTGMATPYLSDEYMVLVGACIEQAKAGDMLAWLYDEDRWPSGAAGGLLTKDPQHRQKHLLFTRHPYGAAGAAPVSDALWTNRTENGRLLACYDVVLDAGGRLSAYRRIGPEDPADGLKLYAYLETDLNNPWFNNQAYADTLSPKTIGAFIELTYQRYARFFSADFGHTVPAIFTDEPQFFHKDTLGFAHEDKDVALPWTDDLEESFSAAYGQSLLAGLPELFWELPAGASQLRYRYHDHIAERFAAAFADQCGAWCARHGLMLTGHMMEEPTLESQTAALGEAMRSYRSFQLPGIDMLCDRREYTTAKQAQSAARQYGRPGVLSELYGVTNWDFDFRGHKLQGDWQAALGVTVRVPHLSWVSMNGEAKRDYPGTFNYQAPWYREYPFIENHFARLNTALTRGRPVVHVGVLHPVESYWLHWGPGQDTAGSRAQMDQRFEDLTQWLLLGLVDFDFICEANLPGQCALEDITGPLLPVGEMAYRLVIVPAMETVRGTTLERLEAFAAKGGQVLFMGGAPTLVDAAPASGPARLCAQCGQIGFERQALVAALAPLREVEILNEEGAQTAHLLHQLRRQGEDRWLFIAQADRPEAPDLVSGEAVTIRVRGIFACRLYDSLTGEITPLTVRHTKDGWTETSRVLYQHDSLLLHFSEAEPAAAAQAGLSQPLQSADGPVQRFLEPVPVTLHEPNVLLLDMAEWRLDDEAWQPVEQVLRIDDAIRRRLNWPMRCDAYAQPWVEQDDSTPHLLTLRFRFASTVAADVTFAAEGNPAAELNSRKLERTDGWYVDRCITQYTPAPVHPGENTLVVRIPYGPRTDVEACYLLGDFGATVCGCAATLTAPVRALCFGDITRQGLPFYGGNLSYHLPVTCEGGAARLAVTSYRGQLIKVLLDGEARGSIAFSPYSLPLEGLAPGGHRLELVLYGNRVNTFGALHHVDRRPGVWWGPNAWRTTDDNWSYEYIFWPQGILKSPEMVENFI